MANRAAVLPCSPMSVSSASLPADVEAALPAQPDAPEVRGAREPSPTDPSRCPSAKAGPAERPAAAALPCAFDPTHGLNAPVLPLRRAAPGAAPRAPWPLIVAPPRHPAPAYLGTFVGAALGSYVAAQDPAPVYEPMGLILCLAAAALGLTSDRARSTLLGLGAFFFGLLVGAALGVAPKRTAAG